MCNERYKLLCIARHSVIKGGDPLTLAFISPPAKGKTDTKRIFLHNYPDCNEINSMSDTALSETLQDKKKSPVLIIDDPLNWIRYDFENAIRYFKALYDGYIVTPRKTKFNPNDVPIPANISTVLMLHTKQYVEVQRTLAITGYDERALMLWSMHDPSSTVKYISRYYREYNISTAKKKYPRYDLDGFNLLADLRETTDREEKWIEDIFQGSGQERTARAIARCVDEKTFWDMRNMLKSKSKSEMFMEDIEFEEI